MNHDKINEIIQEYVENHTCSNYEHKEPTSEDLKAFLFNCMRWL